MKLNSWRKMASQEVYGKINCFKITKGETYNYCLFVSLLTPPMASDYLWYSHTPCYPVVRTTDFPSHKFSGQTLNIGPIAIWSISIYIWINSFDNYKVITKCWILTVQINLTISNELLSMLRELCVCINCMSLRTSMSAITCLCVNVWTIVAKNLVSWWRCLKALSSSTHSWQCRWRCELCQKHLFTTSFYVNRQKRPNSV